MKGEIEDQRIMVESEHTRLIQEHDGLLKVHSKALTAQQRMKNHCTRLQQLQSSTTDTESYKKLKQLLKYQCDF